MSRKHFGKPTVFILLTLLVFLCVVPAVSHAASDSDPLPKPAESYEVTAGTTVEQMLVLFQRNPGWTAVIRETDGSIRNSGLVETGDRLIVTDSNGKLCDCVAITVKDQLAASSETVSSSPSASSALISSAVSQQPSPSSSPVLPADPVFSESISVGALAAVFGEKADRVLVYMPGGVKRDSGLVCTGDRIVLQDESGNTVRALTVTVLGDLTRCGRITETGSTLLYGYLTGQNSLSSDLLSAADINRDGRVDTSDLLSMKIKLRETASSGAAFSGVK